MPFSGNEKKVLAKLKREFFQKGEYGVLDNWIEYQFERNFRNEERTREALAKDKDYRLQIEHLHRQRNQVKENSLKAQKLADEIEMLVRQRNMQLEEVEVNEVPHILIDVHWLTVRRTLEYVSQIEWALKKNPGNLVGKRQILSIMTGRGQNTVDKHSDLKSALLDAHVGRIEVQKGNVGVLDFTVRQRPSVWDYIDYFLKSLT